MLLLNLTRPDIASRLAEVQNQMPQPRVRSLLDANKVSREAHDNPDVSLTYQSIDPQKIMFVAFGDAAFASQKDLWSHQGTIVGATTCDLDANVQAPFSPLVWISKKISRVVRSTLSAEAYAMSKSVDLLGWIRAM